MPKNFKPKQGSGDTGLTDIITGKKIRKTDARIKAIADIDELTCLLGLLKARFKKSSKLKTYIKELEKIQKNLFIVSGIIAGMKCLTEIKTETANLEELTNVLSKKTPKLKNFIIPGKSETEALINLARARARLAEISVWETEKFKAMPGVVSRGYAHQATKSSAVYLNRLSDYLFLLALKSL